VLRQDDHDEPAGNPRSQEGKLDLLREVRIAQQGEVKTRAESETGSWAIYNRAELARTWRKEMNIDDLLNPEHVEELLVDRLAQNYVLPGELHEKVAQRINSIVDERVGAAVDELLVREFQPLDVFGDKAGEPTTIKEMLAKSLQNWWTAPVDSQGKTVLRNYYGHKSSRAEYLVNQIAKEVIDKDLSRELREFASETKTEIRQKMTAAIAEIINKRL
jgi:hypothetical protein